MIKAVFENQVLMTFVIAGFWIIPGIIFTSVTNRKFKIRQRESQLKKISKLYP